MRASRFKRPPVSQVFWDVFEAGGVEWHAPKFERVEGKDGFCPDCFQKPDISAVDAFGVEKNCLVCGVTPLQIGAGAWLGNKFSPLWERVATVGCD